MGFRFIHTADWQLGKTFGQFPAETAFALRAQRLETVRTIAETARGHAVDAVLVAGDAFDSNAVADRTLVQAMEAIAGFAGPWVFLPGNHDAAEAYSAWSRLRALPDLPRQAIIADEPVPLDLWSGAALVLPAPLKRRRAVDDLTRWFDAAPSPEGTIRVGLAHGSVANRLPGSEAGHEIAEDRAVTARLDYLALGDWHGALPAIAPRTAYAGTPEADRHKDNASGSVFLVEIDAPGAPAKLTTLPVGRFTWTRLDIALLDGACDRLVHAFEQLPSLARDTVLSVGLTGAVTLAERQRLEGLRQHWAPRLLHLDIDDTGLRDEPTADDLDAIDTGGFVRLAVDRLRAKAEDAADPERDAAQMALRMVYLDHTGQDR